MNNPVDPRFVKANKYADIAANNNRPGTTKSTHSIAQCIPENLTSLSSPDQIAAQ